MIDNFVSLPPSGFDCLVRSLTENWSAFNSRSAEVFNQQLADTTGYENDGRRRSISLEGWEAVTAANTDARAAIATLREAAKRVGRALPTGYTSPELVALRSDVPCAQQAVHTDYDIAHNDFRDPATAPLSLLAGISNGSRLILWFPGINGDLQPTDIALPRGKAILFHGAQRHSGAAYGHVNYRLFGYLQRPTYVEIPRRTHSQ